ncbi:PREDICTED: CST complex subunit STN1 isoform X2 [Crocodylus porosus]|uniref:CST complex subunit STN1 isoform X2 n=1 Tax=Crocodylus porosus TaxID=8502 RepID=UPI00093B14E3|nr:PREDICTED: CST complex subunit STN1 isoform X2 [Crocodylus porosus]
MQPESAKYEEEMPSLFWALDPVFSTFARLYIKDIKEMRESKQVPGIFFYNGHPIRQVDVVGNVVLTKERDAFYNYGVDDSTGVIHCLCWKSSREVEKPLSAFASQPNTSSNLALLGHVKKLQEVVHQKTKLEIGDVVRVRGYIRLYRGQREIQASTYYKVDDPMYDVQISRMLELPYLYREVYDKPFQMPQEAQSDPNFSMDMFIEKVKDFLMKNRIQTFYAQELETVKSLVSLASEPAPSTSLQQMDSENEPRSKLIHSAFKEAIKVTDHDKELHRMTTDIIKADCQKPRHAEKGCHFLHVLDSVRQSYSPYLTQEVMHRVLELLESNSDIVSTMERHYTAF